METLRFFVNDQLVEERRCSPTTTVLNYLRYEMGLTGTKEGCAEGDCGACTVAVLEHSAPGAPTFRAVNACLLFLPMVQGKRIYTVEGLRQAGEYHPVQHALVKKLGSQCGYCTPGIVMCMFEACYRRDLEGSAPWQIDDQMCGNLCRCTGYRPIREATTEIAGQSPADHFGQVLAKVDAPPASMALDYHATALGAQRFVTPTTLDELFATWSAYPSARLVVGGTDLGLEVTKKFKHLPELISLEAIAELREITRHDTHWSLGAAATLTEVQERTQGEVLALEKMLRFFASRQIRNRATLGGNLCTASPIGDMAPVLIALGARAKLASAAGVRTVLLEDFFVSYRQTLLRPAEVLASIEVPHLDAGAYATSFKVSKRRELDISAVAAGCWITLDAKAHVVAVRLVYGGMAATPARARSTEAALVGKPWTPATVEAALPCLDLDFSPLDDHRGSAWYRARVAKNLLVGFYHESLSRPTLERFGRPTSTVHLEVAT